MGKVYCYSPHRKHYPENTWDSHTCLEKTLREVHSRLYLLRLDEIDRRTRERDWGQPLEIEVLYIKRGKKLVASMHIQKNLKPSITLWKKDCKEKEAKIIYDWGRNAMAKFWSVYPDDKAS